MVMAIIDFRGSSHPSAPSAEYLAFIADVAIDECERRLARLQELGLINVRESGGRLQIDMNPLFDRIAKEVGIPQPTQSL
jgi:hypothetical protein